MFRVEGECGMIVKDADPRRDPPRLRDTAVPFKLSSLTAEILETEPSPEAQRLEGRRLVQGREAAT